MHADLARHFAQDGYDVTFLSSALASRVDKVELPTHLAGQIIVPRQDRWRFRHYFTPAHEFRLKAVAAMRDLDCDAFYSLTYFDAAAWCAAKGKGSTARLIVHSIGVPNAKVYRRVPWDGQMMAGSIKKADKVFVLSRFAADQTHQHYGRMPEVLPPPVDFDAFDKKQMPPDRPTVLFCGDVNEPRKGADVLIRAAGILTKDIPDLTVVYSGAVAPARQASLEALARDSGVSATFLGTGNRSDIPQLYRSASVVVLPSQWEAFGLVLVEAMASGTPVVAAKEGGGADIVNDERVGTLFDANASAPEKVLADAIRQSMEKAQDTATIDACRARARDFDWRQLGPLYRQAVA
ncbi:MAG: glycosyltransferase family 4 protein [Roseobacter sp.]